MTGISGPTPPTWGDIFSMALAKLGFRKRDRFVARVVQIFPPAPS